MVPLTVTFISSALQGTVKAAADPNYTTFLGHFEKVKVADFSTINTESLEQFLEDFKSEIRQWMLTSIPSTQKLGYQGKHNLAIEFWREHGEGLASAVEPKHAFEYLLGAFEAFVKQRGFKIEGVDLVGPLRAVVRKYGPPGIT